MPVVKRLPVFLTYPLFKKKKKKDEKAWRQMKWFPSQSLWRASVWVLYSINTLTDSIHCIDWLSHLDGLLDLMFPIPNATDLLYWWSARWNCGWLWSSRNLKLSVTYLLWGEVPEEDTHTVQYTHLQIVCSAPDCDWLERQLCNQ